jgi:hypothetical protein
MQILQLMSVGMEHKRIYMGWSALGDKEEQLAQQARLGWHLTHVDMWGRYYFQRGEPAELAFCWDRIPKGRSQFDYVEHYRRQGWKRVTSHSGWHRWYCWCTAVVPGQPAPALRTTEETREFLRGLLASQGFGLALLTLILAHKLSGFGEGRGWYHIVSTLAFGFFAINSLLGVLHLRSCLRRLPDTK